MPNSNLLFSFLIILIYSCQKENTLFEKLDAEFTGIKFENTIVEKDTMNILDNEFVFNGGGVAVGDLNNDGLQDVYFTGNQVGNKLYLNKGNLQFEDITEISKTQKAENVWSFGVNMVDINNDGKLDIYVCNSMSPDPEKRRNLLFINQGNNAQKQPIFKEMAHAYGIDDDSHSDNAQFFDYDQDGDLDLFIAVNFIDTQFPNQYMSKIPNDPNRDILYENVGSDSLNHPFYKNVSDQAGIMERGYSHSTLINDINSDGLPDIYVANDYLTNDLFYINTKDKSTGKNIFANKIAEIFNHQSYSAMGSDIADVNNDGLMDIFTTEMLPYYNKRKKLFLNANSYNHYLMTEQYGYQYQFLRNTLQINRGINTATGLPVFSDLSFYTGTQETDWSWAALLADFDNNGFKDLFIANGFPRDITDHDFGVFRKNTTGTTTKDELNRAIPQIKIPNFVFGNYGELNFKDESKNWGITEPSFSNGAAYADLDNDGDLEMITNNINDKAFIYKNNSQEFGQEKKLTSNYLRIKLTGIAPNLDAFGSTVQIFYEGGKSQTSQILSARGYLSMPETILHYGLGTTNKVDSVKIFWPNGNINKILNPKINSLINIKYIKNTEPGFKGNLEETLFTQIDPKTIGLDYKHEEFDFIDFNLQKTLPHKLSQYTPPMAVGDLNGDGLDDIFFGGSSRMPDIVYFQNKAGKFSKKILDNLKKDEKQREENTGILLFDADSDGDNDVYLARGSYQNETKSDLFLDQLLINNGKGNFNVSLNAMEPIRSCTSTVKAADFDQDGDLDLFIGARGLPKSYPKTDESYLLRNDSKEKDQPKFTKVTQQWCPELAQIGMISDAIWSDFDNDNKVDLILAGEWMPITFLKNTGKKFINITPNAGISDKIGWWNSLSAADFDQDGDVDYIAGNLGYNTFFKGTKEEPITLYAKDFDNNQLYDPLISIIWKDSLGKKGEYFYHSRDDMIKQSNLFRAKFKTYGEYGDATVQDVFTKEEMAGAQVFKANWMYSSFIENLGNGKFKMVPLPAEAQYAPIFGTIPYDANSDGLTDILLVGNDYGMELLQGHADAFYGLVLLNFGKNKFNATSLNKSNFLVPNDAKAISRINLGQREYVLATQNKDSIVVHVKKGLSGKSLKVEPNEIKASITFLNGKKQIIEFYWGNTFASQEPRNILVTKTYKKISFFKTKNQLTRSLDF